MYPRNNFGGGGPRKPSPSRVSRLSPHSPFPFGSRSILEPGPLSRTSLLQPPSASGVTSNDLGLAARASYSTESDSESRPRPSSSQYTMMRGRVRAQDVYGGTLAFGGATPHADNVAPVNPSTSQRRKRLMAASPYHSAAAVRITHHNQRRCGGKDQQSSTPAPFSSATPSPSSSCSSVAFRPSSSTPPPSDQTSDGMSSTARLILDTLDKMSTPLRDAQKMIAIPSSSSVGSLSRAEKRLRIIQELDASISDSPLDTSGVKKARRRPRLGSNRPSLVNGDGGDAVYLNGPPARSNAFSPVPSTSRRVTSLKSARLPPEQLQSFASVAPPTSRTCAVSDCKVASETLVKSTFPATLTQTTAASAVSNSRLDSSKSGPLSCGGSSGDFVNFAVSDSGGAKTRAAKSPLEQVRTENVSSSTSMTPVGGGAAARQSYFVPQKLAADGVVAKHNVEFASSTTPKKVAQLNKCQNILTTFKASDSSANWEKPGDSFIFTKPVVVSSTTTVIPTSSVFAFSDPDSSVRCNYLLLSPTTKPSNHRQDNLLPDLTKQQQCKTPVMMFNNSVSAPSSNMFGVGPVNNVKQLSFARTVTQSEGPLKLGGSVMDVLKGKSLPDVTGQATVKPATELKNASVMSVLGGVTSTKMSFDQPSWDPKFISKKPWH